MLTSDLRGAGTEANVHLIMHGTLGDGRRHILTSGHDDFNRHEGDGGGKWIQKLNYTSSIVPCDITSTTLNTHALFACSRGTANVFVIDDEELGELLEVSL